MAKYKQYKIKRTRSRLYKKRKTKKRKVFETIALIVIIGGLGFLGFCVAEPLMNYFKGNSTDEPAVTSWTPEETTLPIVTTELTEATTEPEPALMQAVGYYLPENALESSQSLNTALSAAKSAGAQTVYILLKDTDGYLLYNSSGSAKGTDIIKGTMPLGQISSAAKAMGLTPVAVINTLLDKVTPSVIKDTAYRWADDSYAWLDAAADKGGKLWTDPFRAGTTAYFTELINEITKSGFSTVVLRNTVYPAFLDFDKTILDAHFFAEDRYNALGKLVGTLKTAAEKNGAQVQLEANLADAFTLTQSAELLKSADTEGVGVNLIYNAADFGEELVIGTQTNKLPTNQEDRIITVFELASKLGALKEHQIMPVINSDSLTAEAVKQSVQALIEKGYIIAASK